ncbi:MAG: histone deacetylase family protein [Chloroflexota bacterium]
MHIFYSPHHLLHDTADLIVEGNPFLIEEVPQRVEIIRQAVEQAGLGVAETPDDHGIDPILAVHHADYVHYLQRAYDEYVRVFPKEQAVVPGTFAPRSARHKSRHIYGEAGIYAFGVGAPILQGTWKAAYWSAQCALAAAERILAGERAAYALCRPPGHHAAANLCGGFCYLNNAAIAARYLHQRGKAHGDNSATVAVLDIDYHHGNGTQEIFYADPNVLFCSLHAHPDDDYPYYWGDSDENGTGLAIGANRNWPLPQGVDDPGYLAALAEALEVVRAFKPAFLVVSLGLDTFCGDPVGGFNLTRAGLAAVGQQVAGLELPSLIVQEGGYLLEALGENAVAFLQAFRGA